MNELARWDPFRITGTDTARWSPFDDSLFDVFPAFFRPVVRRPALQGARMDVMENDNAYRIFAELPGVKKEAIQVSVNEGNVTISAELPEENVAGEETSWLLRERSYGKFSRTITLPEAVDENASEAKYTDGVLYLTLPKKQASSAKRLAIH